MKTIKYLISGKCPTRYYQVYDEEYLTDENPKYICSWYKKDEDYKLVIKLNTFLHVFLCEEDETLYYFDRLGRLKMYHKLEDEIAKREPFFDIHLNEKQKVNLPKSFIEKIRIDIE